VKKFDYCFIGAGAGAAPIAYKLAKAGYSICLIEKGPLLKEEDFFKDELAVSRRSIYTPNSDDEYHIVEQRQDSGTFSKERWNLFNGSMVGGSSNLMSGYFHRMKPMDFRLYSEFGAIDGANIVDWPIGYNEFEPYFSEVESLVGVSGTVAKHPFLEPRSTTNYPFEPTWEHPISSWIDTACNTLGYHSLRTARAVLPQSALGRNGCSYSNFCGSYGCATGAKGHGRSAFIEKILHLKNVTLLTETFAYKLVEEQHSITKVLCFNPDKTSLQVHATHFIVAAQAIESVRLLRNSTSKNFKQGVGNNYDQLGKNLIFSAGGSGEGRLHKKNLSPKQQEQLLIKGAFVNRSLQDWYAFSDNNRRYKGGTIDFLFEHANPVAQLMSARYNAQGELLWGKELQEKLKYLQTQSRVLNFEVFVDWLPTDNTYVTISPEDMDRYGVPVAKVRLDAHNHDLFVGRHLASKALNVLKAMGATDISSSISHAPPPNLVAGGCRFGNNIESSVLDANCKVHDCHNLYVTDASFMPTGGSVPYTWSIYANSLRVAEHLLKLSKKGRYA